jgi:hypothetical protein
MANTLKTEADKLIRGGKNAGKKAIEESFAFGQPIYIIEDGLLISVDKSGRKTVIKKLDEQSAKA